MAAAFQAATLDVVPSSTWLLVESTVSKEAPAEFCSWKAVVEVGSWKKALPRTSKLATGAEALDIPKPPLVSIVGIFFAVLVAECSNNCVLVVLPINTFSPPGDVPL